MTILAIPKFREIDRLARYIEPDYRQGNRRAKPPAFMSEPGTQDNGLSVNSVEIHTENQIAAIYEKKFSDSRRLAISTPNIEEYNAAAIEAGTQIRWSIYRTRWEHPGDIAPDASYVHDLKVGNESHCLVKYTTSMGDYAELRFARRMAYKPTFKMI